MWFFDLIGLWLLWKVLVGFRLMVRGISKLRFSLESMMVLTLVGGACAALLMNPDYPLVFGLGIASTMVAVGFLVSYLIILGIYEKDQPYIPVARMGKGNAAAQWVNAVAIQSEIRTPNSAIAVATTSIPASAPPPACPPSSDAS